MCIVTVYYSKTFIEKIGSIKSINILDEDTKTAKKQAHINHLKKYTKSIGSLSCMATKKIYADVRTTTDSREVLLLSRVFALFICSEIVRKQ